MAKCEICQKGAHFGNNVSHSHRRSNAVWKSNVKSVRVCVNIDIITDIQKKIKDFF